MSNLNSATLNELPWVSVMDYLDKEDVTALENALSADKSEIMSIVSGIEDMTSEEEAIMAEAVNVIETHAKLVSKHEDHKVYVIDGICVMVERCIGSCGESLFTNAHGELGTALEKAST